MKGDYEEFFASKAPKNKPNSKPISRLHSKDWQEDKVAEKMKKCDFSPQFNHFRYRNPRIWFEKEKPVEDRPVNFCEWLYLKGFTFFSFLILRPGEDYNPCFRCWSAQVKCQRTVLGCQGGNLGQAAGSGDLYRVGCARHTIFHTLFEVGGQCPPY